MNCGSVGSCRGESGNGLYQWLMCISAMGTGLSNNKIQSYIACSLDLSSRQIWRFIREITSRSATTRRSSQWRRLTMTNCLRPKSPCVSLGIDSMMFKCDPRHGKHTARSLMYKRRSRRSAPFSLCVGRTQVSSAGSIANFAQ